MQILLNVFGASRQVQRSHDAVDRGIVTAANVVDHVIPHRGDWNVFVTGKLQSRCQPCYKSAKRQIELHGYRCDFGFDRYRTNPNHPFNRAR
jgi:hypothetical protein